MPQDGDGDDWLSRTDAALLEGGVDRMCRWIVGVLALGVVAIVVLGE